MRHRIRVAGSRNRGFRKTDVSVFNATPASSQSYVFLHSVATHPKFRQTSFHPPIGWANRRRGSARHRRQLKSSAGRSPRRVLHEIRARDRDAAAKLANLYQLRGLVPIALRLAADVRAGALSEPGADFYRAAGFIHQLGLIPGSEFIRTILQVHGRQHCVESTTDSSRLSTFSMNPDKFSV